MAAKKYKQPTPLAHRTFLKIESLLKEYPTATVDDACKIMRVKRPTFEYRRKLVVGLTTQEQTLMAEFNLSTVQAEIVWLLVRAKSTRDICADLALSHASFRCKLTRIFKKTKVKSRFELIARASQVIGAHHAEASSSRS